MVGKLVILGNACRDVTYRLRSLPRPGETLNALAVDRDLGGKGLLQAIAARRAGADPLLIAAVGNDESAAAIRSALAKEGMGIGGLIPCKGASDSSVVLLDDNGENAIVSHTALSEHLTSAQVETRLRLHSNDVLLMQGNLSQALTIWAAERAKVAGAHVVVNGAPVRPWFSQALGRIGVGVANAGEAKEWTGALTARAAAAAIDAALVLITLGRDGCLVREATDAILVIGAPPVQVVDTTGAGDVFTGTFVAEWMRTGDPIASAELAVHAASDMVTRFGTVSALPTTESVERFRMSPSNGRPPVPAI
jgi:ribokinase